MATGCWRIRPERQRSLAASLELEPRVQLELCRSTWSTGRIVAAGSVNKRDGRRHVKISGSLLVIRTVCSK